MTIGKLHYKSTGRFINGLEMRLTANRLSPSRRAGLSPALAILIGVISMPPGYALKGAIGGALVGLGIAAVLMGIWGLAASWFGPKPLRMIIRPRQKSLSDQAKF